MDHCCGHLERFEGGGCVIWCWGFWVRWVRRFWFGYPWFVREVERGRRNVSGSGSGVNDHQYDYIPITYAITSIIAFVSIIQLQPCSTSTNKCTPNDNFGTFYPHFWYWLQCPHLILVLSIFIPDFKLLSCIHPSLLFDVLAIRCFGWHVNQIMGNMASCTLPMRGRQISITTDLVCCCFCHIPPILGSATDSISQSLASFNNNKCCYHSPSKSSAADSISQLQIKGSARDTIS